MNEDASGLWWLMAVVTGAVGMGMIVFGAKQKNALSLVFGLGISVIPMVVSSGWASLVLFVAAIALFIGLRKYV